MSGDDRSRFCRECQLHVHNIAAMPRDEAEEVIARGERGEGVCVRMEFEPDGRCVTNETSEEPAKKPSKVTFWALAVSASALAACQSEEQQEVEEPLLIEVEEAHPTSEPALPEIEAATSSLEEPEVDMQDHPVLMGRICMENARNLTPPGTAVKGTKLPVVPVQPATVGAAPPTNSAPAPPKNRVMLGSPGPRPPKPAPVPKPVEDPK